MTNLKSQSGRSMVEMLGVLAIIGVLSIGGIAGYTMAMNRYRANEILSYSSQASILAQTANAGQGSALADADIRSQLGLSADANLFHGATIAVDATGYVTLTNVPENVATAMNSIIGQDICEGTTCEYDPGTRTQRPAAQQPVDPENGDTGE